MPESEERPHEPQEADRKPAQDARTGRSAAAVRMQHQASWVDQQVRVAMAKGEFDNLPGAGKPIKDLGRQHDPDWWLKKLVEREQIALLPPSVQLRKEDAELDARLDTLNVEAEVRREVEEFNARVIAARYRPPEGPPLITMPREVDVEVERWRERRAALRARQAEAVRASAPAPAPPRRRRWWRR
ncbi:MULTISPECIES: DnaJ family domain-containing protein [unclassified Nocardioides]|uniref:DnaJ family domain-containing protein n=1 Tax=unclassified Nocardioides TaxID=2615069 RepID=UPI0036D2D587